MKKIVFLALAVIMLVSLLVGAVGAVEFSDAAEIDWKNTEAVTVLSGMGIIGGMGDGTFQPDGTLTRAQAAKIIAYMKLGAQKAEALPADKSAFTDVPTSHWSCKYVNYCAEQGIVSGVGGGKFNPNGQLTGFQFGKMVLVAAGFNADAEGMTGSEWDINVNKLLKSTWLNIGVTVNSKELSRQDACHLALNALFYGEDKDPYSTLAYKAFTVSRSAGGNDKEDFRRPWIIYTTEESDLCWEGTSLTVKASPFLTYDGKFTCAQLYRDLGDRTFEFDNLTGWRNGMAWGPSGSEGYIPSASDSTVYKLSEAGVDTDWYFNAVDGLYTFVMQGKRACRITAVKEAVIASNGTVMEPGSVTISALGNTFTCASNDFTAADVDSWAICKTYGKSSWKEITDFKEAARPIIVTGVLQSDDKSVRVGGKTYTPLYSPMASTSELPCTASDYIAAGGAAGDTVHVVTDAQNVCYGIFQ